MSPSVPDYPAQVDLWIAAPAERVWEGLTEPDQVRGWMHGTGLRTDWQVGAEIFWEGEWEGRAYRDRGRVLVCQPHEELAFSHWSPLAGTPDAPENYHVVSFRLTPEGAATHVVLTQSNNPSPEAAEAMAQGWRQMMETLKAALEGG